MVSQLWNGVERKLVHQDEFLICALIPATKLKSIRNDAFFISFCHILKQQQSMFAAFFYLDY